MKPLERIAIACAVAAISIGVLAIIMPRQASPTGYTVASGSITTPEDNGLPAGTAGQGSQQPVVAPPQDSEQKDGGGQTTDQQAAQPSQGAAGGFSGGGGGGGGGGGAPNSTTAQPSTPSEPQAVFDELLPPSADSSAPVPNLPVSGPNVQFAGMPF